MKISEDVALRQLDASKPAGKCRRWLICTRLDERDRRGQRKWRRRQFDGTYTEAKSEAERTAKEMDALARHGCPTFEEYAAQWNGSRAAAGAITEVTRSKNEALMACMSPFIGKKRLDSISPDDVTRAYISLRRDRRLSGTTLSCVHAVCWSMMNRALKRGLIASNPFDSALIDRPRADTMERSAMTIAESERFKPLLDLSNAYHVAILLMMDAGLRRGECCALRWSDVSNGRVHVRGSMLDDGTVVPPKCGSARSIPMTASLRSALDALKGDANPPKTAHVITGSDGSPLMPHSLTSWWRRHRAEFGMDGWTLHQFRHTFCSALAESGVHPRVMQALMGHSTESMTMRVYSHVSDGQNDSAIAALESAQRRIGAESAQRHEEQHKKAGRDEAHFPAVTCDDASGGRNRVRTCGPFRVKEEECVCNDEKRWSALCAVFSEEELVDLLAFLTQRFG